MSTLGNGATNIADALCTVHGHDRNLPTRDERSGRSQDRTGAMLESAAIDESMIARLEYDRNGGNSTSSPPNERDTEIDHRCLLCGKDVAAVRQLTSRYHAPMRLAG